MGTNPVIRTIAVAVCVGGAFCAFGFMRQIRESVGWSTARITLDAAIVVAATAIVAAGAARIRSRSLVAPNGSASTRIAWSVLAALIGIASAELYQEADESQFIDEYSAVNSDRGSSQHHKPSEWPWEFGRPRRWPFDGSGLVLHPERGLSATD